MSEHGKLDVAWLYDDSLDTTDGVAQYVKTLGAWLSEQGHNVTYLVGETKIKNWQGAPVHSLSKNLNVRWGGNRLTIPLRANAKAIKRILNENHFDVVHVTLPYSPIMAKKVINSLEDETALVGTWHIYPARKSAVVGGKGLRLAYGRSLSRFDEFVSVSPAAQAYAKKVFGRDSSIVPNAVKLPAQKLQKPVPNRIVFLGRLVKRKGAEQLIRAVAALHKSLGDVELVIAGEGPLKSNLQKLVDNLGISGVVKFVGYVDEAKKFELLSSASVACFPSLYGESFGIVLIEAMAAGAKVVLGGDNPGYRSVLGEKEILLINPKDTADFAERLRELLTDQKLAGEISDWQNRQVKKYEVKVVGSQLAELYQRMIAKRRASGHN